VIKINNIHKSFGSKNVLNGVNLNIENNKITCIIGKSGCGKSVLLKLIVRLIEADKGDISIDDNIISNLSYNEIFNIRRTFGYVFQSAALFDSYNIYENVILSLYEHGEKDKVALENEAIRVLSAVGLLPNRESSNFAKEWEILKYKKPSDLSGGMRKRVGVARALVGSPKYIFYDEPTTGLDPVTSEQIDDLIKDLSDKLGITSIVITHDMFSVYRIADHVAMLNNGKFEFEGTPEDLRSTDNKVVKEFIERFE
jgi:phospholipid/cholesterol/gamma-HCH transport system ATP-binding protein